MQGVIIRLFTLVYYIAHAPLIFIFANEIITSNYADYANVFKYKAVCSSSSQPVVLQSDKKNPFTFTKEALENDVAGLRETLRFYCQYSTEIDNLKNQYENAKDRDEIDAANKAFFNFRDSVDVTHTDNYRLMPVWHLNRYKVLLIGIASGILYSAFYYLCLQLVRLAWQYVVYGCITLNPYKSPLKKKGRKSNQTILDSEE